MTEDRDNSLAEEAVKEMHECVNPHGYRSCTRMHIEKYLRKQRYEIVEDKLTELGEIFACQRYTNGSERDKFRRIMHDIVIELLSSGHEDENKPVMQVQLACGEETSSPEHECFCRHCNHHETVEECIAAECGCC